MSSQAEKWFKDTEQLRMAHAIDRSDTSAIRKLLQQRMVSPDDYGVVHQENEQPISFLTYAVMVKNKPAIEALIADGAKVNFKTPDGWSAMAEAAKSEDDSILPLLIKAGGSVNLTDNAGRPMTIAAYMSRRYANVHFLLDHGANINAQDSSQQTLLMVMANLNDYAHMLDLMKRGADPTISSGANHVTVAWTVQDSAGRLTPDGEQQRQQVIKALEAKGIHFPVPKPPTYKWDPVQQKFVLPASA